MKMKDGVIKITMAEVYRSDLVMEEYDSIQVPVPFILIDSLSNLCYVLSTTNKVAS